MIEFCIDVEMLLLGLGIGGAIVIGNMITMWLSMKLLTNKKFLKKYFEIIKETSENLYE